MVLVDGHLPDGTRVRVEWGPVAVLVDGEEVEHGLANVYRDGGTIRIDTRRGEFVDARKRIANRGKDVVPTLDGEPIT